MRFKVLHFTQYSMNDVRLAWPRLSIKSVDELKFGAALYEIIY